MQQRPLPPHARSLAYLNSGDTFKTTYNSSYKEVPTYYASPVYDRIHDPEGYDARRYGVFPRDLSPYPLTRDDSPGLSRKPYQTEPNYYDSEEPRTYRSRFEDTTLRRDEYMEPPPKHRDGTNYDMELNTPRGRQMERGPRPGPRHSDMQQQYMPDPGDRYQHQLARDDEEDRHHRDLRPVFCNKCFKSEACVNKLGCGHLYCDECMARLPGSDNPFRDSIRWHYCCEIPDCKNKWTSESKLVRLDPYGRRLESLYDQVKV